MVRLTDRPDMTLDVYRGRKTTMQQFYFPYCSGFFRKKETFWGVGIAVDNLRVTSNRTILLAISKIKNF